MSVLTGNCLCGGVRFEVTEPFAYVTQCHCEFCKRISGGYGTVSGRAPTSAIRVLQGEELLRSYTPEGGSAKTFCSTCGSNLFGAGWPNSEASAVRLTALDDAAGQKPQVHIFVRSVAEWETLPEDGLPRFDERPS